ncbi:hypothetical protein [Nannocystis punicea]|uniref:Uncharacterized protein n=1 Tax=Nannocystis punicea TaxID=2995304 RepID=A0ABY7HDL0_9BACT|nr:hypothetical protein [Nannocystis poenicansa]WAS97187.1 hypothetical protein O0S08_13650 [Nannocystis poenicansa]
MLSTPRLALVLAAVSLGCSPTTSGSTTPPDNTAGGSTGPTIGGPPADGAATPGDAQNPSAGGGTTDPAGGTTGAGPGVVAGSPNDTRFLAPEISHSKGVPGGVVVLFPRIIPSAIAAENQSYGQQIQQKMKQLVEKALPGRPIDVRPSPERVCPKAGCDAMSIGVLFTRQNNSCVAVALVNAPGVSTTKLVPWGGEITLKADPIQFRDPPENFVTIKDYANCDQLVAEMGKQDSFVEAAVRAAAGSAAAGTPANPTSPGVSTPATPASSTVTAKPSGK